jgi:hypothetical protein
MEIRKRALPTRRCGARTRAGGSCNKSAGAGTPHSGFGRCALHGGCTPDHIKHAALQQAMEFVTGALGHETDVDPLDATLMAVRLAAGAVGYWRHQLAETQQDGGRPTDTQIEGLPSPTPDGAITEALNALGTWCRASGENIAHVGAGELLAAGQAFGQIVALATEQDLEAGDAGAALELLRAAEHQADTASTRAESAAQAGTQRLSERVRLEAQISEEADQIAVLSELVKEPRADRFGEYIIEQTLTVLSSDELMRISDQRYSLVSGEGEFAVVDHANADEQRSVKTLSGGETFLASLALALALSRHVGSLASEGLGTKLEPVFIDEGFGALAPATLEDVIDALERLREDDLVVGVISHVPELAQRIQTGLEARKADGGSRHAGFKRTQRCEISDFSRGKRIHDVLNTELDGQCELLIP